jgi:hypothetical protein
MIAEGPTRRPGGEAQEEEGDPLELCQSHATISRSSRGKSTGSSRVITEEADQWDLPSRALRPAERGAHNPWT